MILLDGWAGVWHQHVDVIGATPKRYRCKALGPTQVAGRARWKDAGDIFLVPKHAVRFCKPSDGIASLAAAIHEAKYVG